MTCRLCGNDNVVYLFQASNTHGRHTLGDEKFDVYECLSCHVIFVDVLLDDAYYSKFYLSDYYEGTNGGRRGASFLLNRLKRICFLRRLRIIRKYSANSRDKNILEIGCGKGEFLAFLPGIWNKYGAEINQEACFYMQEHHKDITVFNRQITSDDFDKSQGSFDIIGMWHVLEHLDDPHAFLESIKKKLSPNGVFIFDIPNSGALGFRWTKDLWFHLDAPRHLFLYNRESISWLMQRHGLKIVHYSADSFGYFQDLSFSAYRKFGKNNIVVKIIFGLILLPVLFIIRLFISVFFPGLAEINTYVAKRVL